MSAWTIPGRYDFSIPEAQRLSDLSGIDSDLEAVIRLCTRCENLITSLSNGPEADGLAWFEDFQALGDLMFAAVVRYGRTLTSGARRGIPSEWIESLTVPLREAHAYFKVLRDKYVAHSVSQLEDNQVFVMLSPQFATDQEPSHITVDRGRLVTLSVKDIQRLRSLAEELRSRVSSEIEAESATLLEFARQMPIETIRQRGSESIPVPSTAAAFKVRGKF
jgi:hypothetical protein